MLVSINLDIPVALQAHKELVSFFGSVKSIAFYDQYSPKFSAVLPDFQKRGFYQFRPLDDSLSCFWKYKIIAF